MKWAAEFLQQPEVELQGDQMMEEIWAEAGRGVATEKENFWDHLETEWDSLAKAGQHDWLDDYQTFTEAQRVKMRKKLQIPILKLNLHFLAFLSIPR